MIIKSLSRQSGGIGQLFTYLNREKKVTRKTYSKLTEMLNTKALEGKPMYVAGIKLTSRDAKYLLTEIQDVKLQQSLKEFKGTIKEFIQLQLVGINPEIVKESKQLLATHNVKGQLLNEIIREYKTVDANRIHQRKDQTAVQHIILSWSDKDAEKIDDRKLKSISKEFIRLYGEDNLYTFFKHEDQNHKHLHAAISGTKLNGLSSRMSKSKFQEIKIELDKFQQKKFPELVNSLPSHGKSTKEKGITKNINSERSLDKDKLSMLLETTYSKATSIEHFLSQMKSLGHEPYYRNGKLQGVKYDGERKFRFSRLGYDEKKLLDLNTKEKGLKELQSLRTARTSRFREVAIEEKDKTRSASLTGTKAESELQNLRDIRQSRDRGREINNAQDGMERDIADTQNNSQSKHDDKQTEDMNYHNDKMEHLENEKDNSDTNDEDDKK